MTLTRRDFLMQSALYSHLIDADTGTVCIVGKCWDYHVLEALGTVYDPELDEPITTLGFVGLDELEQPGTLARGRSQAQLVTVECLGGAASVVAQAARERTTTY